MKRLKKSFFTILEILVSLSLLLVIAAITGIQLRGAYKEQQFLSEVQQVVSHLRMAQDLMLILNTDVKFKMMLDEDKKQIKYWLEMDQPIAFPALTKKLQNEKGNFTPHFLTQIQSLRFSGETNMGHLTGEEGKNTLIFSLGKMSQGVLKLLAEPEESEKSDPDSYKRYVILWGHPHPIQSITAKELEKEVETIRNLDEERKKEGEELYPRESNLVS